ncbi:MAG: type II CAAX endopeptidase family protein [Acholeplasmataceae bacterium]|nr:type II CAAX endopeptidase family protein [Acholeplasmataceae bacterium]
MNNDQSKILIFQKILIVFLILLMVFFMLFDFNLFNHPKDNSIITRSILRFLGGTAFVVMLISFGYSSILSFKNVKKSLLIMIPAFIISINNFPIIAYLSGRTTLTEPIYRVYLFLIECLSVGFFEEILFRGIILMFLVKKLEHVKNGLLISIVLSSLMFGFIHILNLYSGASVSSTFLQIGYSFLIGMMWAVMFLKTGNLWLVMLLHATFNFFGQVMFYLGRVDGRYDIYTIGITALFAGIAAAYTYVIYRQMTEKPIHDLKSL